MSDQLVQDMGVFSFDFHTKYGSEDSSMYHELYLNELEAWLRTKGYVTARERPIMYVHRDRKSDAISSKRGLIDLYAKNRDQKVAVEFDNGKRLKFKSIEKMNNSDADILVGVIVGGADDKSIKFNYQRYSEIASNNLSVNRDVWLIILSESRIELLSTRWKEKTPFGSEHPRSTKSDSGIGVKAITDKNENRKRAIEEY